MAGKKRGIEEEEAPLEAHPPTVIRVGGGVSNAASVTSLEGLETLPGHIVHGCDGDDMYVWWVRPNKKGTGLRVTEVSPGLDKKNTRLRRVDNASDLTYSEKKTLEQLIARWTKALVGDLVPEKKRVIENNTVDDTLEDEASDDVDLDEGEVDGDDW